MDETTITLAGIFISIVLIAVFALTLWHVLSYFWRNLYGWYQERKTEKVMEWWEKAKKLT